MLSRLLILMITVSSLSTATYSGPANVQASAPPKHRSMITPSTELDNKAFVGEAEYIKVLPGQLTFKARIDTGAKDTSIGAYDIKEFERDGRRWVKFFLKDEDGNPHEFNQKIVGQTLIKQHSGEPIRRLEVQMTIVLGNHSQTITVNLANREQYQYPVLIGRNYLTGNFIIDPSKKYFQGLPKK